MFEEFISNLEKGLQCPLPGIKAQLMMASSSRLRWIQQWMDTSGAKESSVLILLYPDGDKVKTVLILRQDNSGVHSGQVSFPGGRREETDKTLFDTALREAYEEIGLKRTEVKILGHLTNLYIPPSNFNVFPVVGYISEKPSFRIDKSEVNHIIEVAIADLLDDRYRKVKDIKAGIFTIHAPCFEIDGVTIWGATAMIISELLEVIKSLTNK
jgi:8-oxo-dGTP pyrophosphatase MutT (NUDIX family)